MAVELILLEDVEDLGKAGEKVNVAPGYARNYLLPKGLAEKITPGALRQIEARRERIEAKRKQDLDNATALAAKIAETEITIPMQAGEDDQLFGSVTSHLIADALKEQGIEIESRKIKLEEPLKELGVFNVSIKLHSDVDAMAKVWVVRA
jgi:large subunit ribosomal protein L9